MKINSKFVVTKHQVHFQPIYMQSSNTLQQGSFLDWLSISQISYVTALK